MSSNSITSPALMDTPLRPPKLMVGLVVVRVLPGPEFEPVNCSDKVGRVLGACVSTLITAIELVRPMFPAASFQLPALRLMVPVLVFVGGVSVAV